jgi:hypothetical protein
MPHFHQLGQFLKSFAKPERESVDLDDVPAKDAVMHDMPPERNAAWSATAIYGFVPFQSPMSR